MDVALQSIAALVLQPRIIQPWLIFAAIPAIWLAGRLLAAYLLLLPGVVAGIAAGLWLHAAQHWQPAPAIVAGVLLSIALYWIAAAFFIARLATAALLAPAALWALWNVARAAFDPGWALAITVAAALALASLVRRFLASEDQALRMAITDLIDDLRGD